LSSEELRGASRKTEEVSVLFIRSPFFVRSETYVVGSRVIEQVHSLLLSVVDERDSGKLKNKDSKTRISFNASCLFSLGELWGLTIIIPT
jgi:hypothetical protein